MPEPKTDNPPKKDIPPLPETIEAQQLGCNCKIARDERGNPVRGNNGANLYTIEKGRPIHS
jgi:hypothetical protein